MIRGPLDESICVFSHRGWRRIHNVLEDAIEHRSSVFREIGHERAEFAVEVGKKQEGLVVQHGEARVVNGADSILRLEQRRHHWWKLFWQRLCVRRRFQGEADGEVTLATQVISPSSSAPAEAGSEGVLISSSDLCVLL